MQLVQDVRADVELLHELARAYPRAHLVLLLLFLRNRRYRSPGRRWHGQGLLEKSKAQNLPFGAAVGAFGVVQTLAYLLTLKFTVRPHNTVVNSDIILFTNE